MKNVEIRKAMKAADLKQWELAEMMNISEFTLSRKMRTELPEDMKQHLLELINDRQQKTTMRIVAAKIEKIIWFSNEQAADIYCEEKKKVDPNFELLDYDNTGDDECVDAYTIKVVESFEGVPMLVSSMTIDNDPEI